jgi:isoleucyl-tRNA synthetase
MANEEIGYLLIRRKEDGKVLIIGDERAEQLEELVGSDYEVLKKFQGMLDTVFFIPESVLSYSTAWSVSRLGSALIGSTYKSLFPSSSRSSSPSIISSSHVKSNYGTGLVHCAPAHGVEDYAAFKASLPSSSVSSFTLRCPIDDDGKFVGIGEGGEDLEGKDILGDGIEAMIQLGRERGWILGEKEVKHSYPYDWKSKKPVIIRCGSFVILERSRRSS